LEIGPFGFLVLFRVSIFGLRIYGLLKGGFMPRRERDRELARRRKRKKERRKLRTKGLLESPPGAQKEGEKRKPEKAPAKEAVREDSEKPASEV
jgi:hypothetical protein